MTEFDEFFEDAFDTLLLSVGETITYHPRCGGSRVIDAIVDRSPPEAWDIAGGAITPLLTVRVQNDSSTGISHAELDTGDVVSVALKAKGEKTRRTFTKVESSDGQVTELAVR